VGEILDFSKLRSNKAELFLGDVKLDEVVPSVVSLSSGLLGNKEIKLRTEIEDDLPVIVGDKQRLEQVFLNVIGNAVKFTESGEILIKVFKDEVSVHISVRDTGCGIDYLNLERIWKPYEQSESADIRRAGGTGLGLPIAKYLVELHGGGIWAESRKNGGSTFHIVLPIETPKEIAGISLESYDDERSVTPLYVQEDINTFLTRNDMPAKVRETRSHESSILVVDDDTINLHLMKKILEKQGYYVRTAEDGYHALEIIDHEKPGLILLDLMLPGMSGYDVMVQLNQKYADYFIPVIMVTAKNQLEDMVKGFVFGCNDYLTKPFNPKELLVRVQNQLVMKNIFDMERDMHDQLATAKEELEVSLLERSRMFRNAVGKMRNWESIITEDLKISKNFIAKMMSREIKSDSLEFAVHYDPLLEIGGDLYDIYEYKDNRIRIFLADATGHGINASLNSIAIMSEYNLIKDSAMSPAEILSTLNQNFCNPHGGNKTGFSCCIV